MMYMPILIKRGNMNIFFCIMLFIMGSFFGSFFTLAVYRLPLKKNITYERSFCPNCNHRLEAIDLVPIFSYIFLGGKCRYCKEKIRIRYLLLEVLSGIVFVLAYLSFNMTYPFITFAGALDLILFISMYIVLAIIAGIDKEKNIIQRNVLIFGFVTRLIYELYVYYGLNIHNNYVVNLKLNMIIIFLIFYAIYLYFISSRDKIKVELKNGIEDIKNNEEKIIKEAEKELNYREKFRYFIDVVALLIYIFVSTNLYVFICTIGILLIVFGIMKILKIKKIPVAFILTIITMIVSLAYNGIYYF